MERCKAIKLDLGEETTIEIHGVSIPVKVTKSRRGQVNLWLPHWVAVESLTIEPPEEEPEE